MANLKCAKLNRHAANPEHAVPDVTTVWRWRSRGVRGIRLDTVCIGGRRYTSTFVATIVPPLPSHHNEKRLRPFTFQAPEIHVVPTASYPKPLGPLRSSITLISNIATSFPRPKNSVFHFGIAADFEFPSRAMEVRSQSGCFR